MASYDDFLEYVAPAVPGAAHPLMLRAIRDACVDFCVESQLIQQALEPILSIANIADYPIETPEGTKVSQILRASYDGRDLQDIVQREATTGTLTAQFGVSTQPGTPRKILYSGNDTLLLDPIPESSDKDLILVAALKPARSASDLVDIFGQLYEDYAETIGEGALAKIMDIKSAVFYDPAESAIKQKKFMAGVAHAMVRANQGNLGRKSLRVRYRRI